NSGAGDLAVDELEPGWDGAIREQAFPRADDHREDPQTVFIDNVVAQQRLDQVRAAVNLQLRPILFLEHCETVGGISLDQDRVAPPLQVRAAPRRNVLR